MERHEGQKWLFLQPLQAKIGSGTHGRWKLIGNLKENWCESKDSLSKQSSVQYASEMLKICCALQQVFPQCLRVVKAGHRKPWNIKKAQRSPLESLCEAAGVQWTLSHQTDWVPYSTFKNQPEHLMRPPAGTPNYQQPFKTSSFYRNATSKICTQKKTEGIFGRIYVLWHQNGQMWHYCFKFKPHVNRQQSLTNTCIPCLKIHTGIV